MSDIRDLLSKDAIELGIDERTWQDSIRRAGTILENRKIAGPSYTQAMIDSVDRHGPYIVIAPGFAFAHARPDNSVTATGMSLVRLQEPVKFGHPNNDPVTLVMALAATNADQHQAALAQLAKVLSNTDKRTALEKALTADEILAVFDAHIRSETSEARDGKATASSESQALASGSTAAETRTGKNLVLTVCGNGLGTSLFLKNTLEQVLDYWGWSPYLTVEATDTISARGKSSDADFILTSGEIAKTLGEVDVPVRVINDFTSQAEIDAALRELYDV
ncbi:PTS sugar transporter subunit IIA [Rothia terrae]|uniref:Ascorbate-specific PTS system EIIA component n=1 Tax=Rothia terrae TaxID=396015 RepID=A0A7H2BBX6_9MICC|nr:PTS sugar transporter subunit IIA [Rothia terrae]MDT0190343.1 PTS sugar transporter subunit IIA [Rothia terrae]QNV37172.1 PTS sugar transporter subunit IIA [Rothia terrae]